MSSLSEIRKRTAEVMTPTNELRCSVCQTPTKWETLSNYGARCFQCYEKFLRHGPEEAQCGQAAWVKAAAEKAKLGPKSRFNRLLGSEK